MMKAEAWCLSRIIRYKIKVQCLFSKVQHSHLTILEMSSMSVLMPLILSKLARVWMDTYWSPSIWEIR